MASKKQDGKTKKKKREYDSAWKEVIEEHFESFLEFFFPEIHRDIDFSKGFEFLSKELRQITPVGAVGKRYADELIKVYLKDGSVEYLCIFIHIEVHGKKTDNFEERLYIYNYRIFNQYKEKGIEVISLAILTDEDENYRPDEYHVGRWGFDLRMKIPLVKLIDFKNKEEYKEKLEASTNPMAMVVKAQLKSYDAKEGDDNKRYDVKWELIRRCFKRGYHKKQIWTLLMFIDWTIRLPDEFESRIAEKIIRIEEENKMAYVTSWERLAEKRGKKKWKKEGMKEGKLEVAIEMLKKGLDKDLIATVTGFPKNRIDELTAETH